MSHQTKQLCKNPLKILVIGAGERGNAYASALYAIDKAYVAAVAEIDDGKRSRFARQFRIVESNVFNDWKEVVQRASEGKRLDVDGVLICTLDWQHEAVCIDTI